MNIRRPQNFRFEETYLHLMADTQQALFIGLLLYVNAMCGLDQTHHKDT
jgi:hypothetical protein